MAVWLLQTAKELPHLKYWTVLFGLWSPEGLCTSAAECSEPGTFGFAVFVPEREARLPVGQGFPQGDARLPLGSDSNAGC